MMIHMDGFGQFFNSGTQAPQHLRDAGYSAASALTITAGPETGTHAVQIPAGGSFGRTFQAAGPRLVIGFAYWASHRSTIAVISGLGAMAWPNAVQLLGVSGTAVPIPNVWAYYELDINKGAGTVEMWQNNRREITADLPSAVLDMDEFSLSIGGPGELGSTARVSGLYAHTERLGPIAVETDLPLSDFHVEWVPSAGAAHAPLVNTRPPNDATFVQSAQSGAQDLYRFPAKEVTDPIIAVGLVARACKTDLDLRQLGIAVGSSSQQLERITSDLTLDYKYHYAFFEESPADAAWAAEDLELEPGGVIVRP